MKISTAAYSLIGGREMNQDAWLVDTDRQLFAVADGVGGGLHGEVASNMAVTGLKELYQKNANLRDVVTQLQERVLKQALESCNGEPLMGTTLSFAVFEEGVLRVCHVGDSRCYLFQENHLKQVTEDHEAYEESVGGSVLNSYLGLDTRVYTLKIQIESLAVKPGDKVLLCTDGLYKQIEEMELANAIRNQKEEGQPFLESLCREASKAEYSDNVTAVYLQFEE